MNWVDSTLLLHGENPALRAGSAALNRTELRTLVLEAERELSKSGIDDSTVVLFRVAPGIAFVTHLLALLRIEAQLAIVDHRIVGDALMIASKAILPTHEVHSTAILAPIRGFSTAGASIRQVAPERRRVSGHDVIQLSSGTTALPKLVRRTASSIRAEILRYGSLGTICAEAESVVIASSLAHTWGLYGGLLSGLAEGGEVVIARSPTPRGVLSDIAASTRPAVVLGVPIHVAMLRSAASVPAQLTRILSAGEVLDAADAETASAVLGDVRIGQTYGMTELGVIAADLRGEFPGSVGSIAEDLDFRVNSNDELEIALSMSPYLSAAVDAGRWESGWFQTRDVVSVSDRRLFLRGRLDGLISLGGKKFHVAEIEHHLRSSPLIEEAVVFVTGGLIEAFVKSAASTDVINAYADTLPEYLRPHVLVVVQSVPKTPSGKLIRRRELLPSNRG